MKHVLLITSRSPRHADARTVLRDVVLEAARRVDQEVDVTSVLDHRAAMKSIQECISRADLVLVDVSDSRQDVMYELGFAHGAAKPTILVSDHSSQPTLYDLATLHVVLYGGSPVDVAFRERLATTVADALSEPERFTLRARTATGAMPRPTVFVSYSRADAPCLERLRVHIRPLEREQAIEFWDDGRIAAGQDWRDEISAALGRVRIAVLLISADFLASEFVINNELPALLKAAEARGTTILPVILKPSRFLKDPRLSIYQAVNDPRRPLLALPNIEQEEIYARIADRIENELRETG